MATAIKLMVWGEYASFNRPEMKVERVSYDVITPSAARGILEAIHWKPQIRWVIDKIHVLKPIQYTHVRRNEIASKIPMKSVTAAMKSGSGSLGIAVEDYRQQRAAMILRDVCYGIEAHIAVLDSTELDGSTIENPEAKHTDIFKRRTARGQYFHHPYLGCREFPASFKLVDSFPPCPDELNTNNDRDLGFMLHDIQFIPDKKGSIVESSRGERVTAHPHFFRAIMRNGVITVPDSDEGRK